MTHKNNKKLRKLLTLVCCAALLVCVTIAGTVAYLTSTDTVTNTFTVGQVKITLDEAKVGTDGKALTGDSAKRVKENEYKLMPGHVYDKDPTVTVKAGSEESYVRMLVTVNFGKKLTDTQLATQLDSIITGYGNNWVRKSKSVSEVENKTTITYEYRYVNGETTTVAATTEDSKLRALFTGIKVPENWTNKTLEDIGGFTINVVAQAIQADGFKDADAAWAAYPAETNTDA